jgi:hypothetical protein
MRWHVRRSIRTGPVRWNLSNAVGCALGGAENAASEAHQFGDAAAASGQEPIVQLGLTMGAH